MHHLKLPYLLPVMALLLIGMLSACADDPGPDPGNEKPVEPEVSSMPVPATPRREEQPASQAENQPPEEARSADSLILTIKESPFEEPSKTGFGVKPDSDWLDKSSDGTHMGNMPADDGLLPDLFGSKDKDKAASVKMDVLVDDEQQDMTNAIDGAGVSIKYKTD